MHDASPLCNTHGTHATYNTTRRRQHDDDDDNDDPRACSGGGGGGARSLARSRARAVAVAMAVAIAAYDARAFDDARYATLTRGVCDDERAQRSLAN